MKPTFTSIFSLNTDSFDKLHKELGIVLYHGLKTPRSVLKILGYRLVFQHTSRCFDTVVKNAFLFFIYYVISFPEEMETSACTWGQTEP